MRNDHEAIEGYLGTIGGWLEGDLLRRMPGGETGHEFLARYDAAVARVCARGSDVTLVVSHGAAIRTWVTHRAGGDHAPIHEGLHNTGCITLDGSPDERLDGRLVAPRAHRRSVARRPGRPGPDRG